MEILFWYIMVGCFVMSVFFILNNSIFVTISISGFISGIFLWPLIVLSIIRDYLK